jgi:hypothetical protein
VSQRKSKANIVVLSSAGQAFTTHRGARRLERRGLVKWISASAVRMIETDHRFQNHHAAPAHSPDLTVVAGQLAIGEYRNRVLGLPNFVRFQNPRKPNGKVKQTECNSQAA